MIVIYFFISIPAFWAISEIYKYSENGKIQTYNNLPDHLKERYYNTLPDHLKAQINKPIPTPRVPQLAQSTFFDPNPPIIPDGYTELGIIPSDGSEVEFTMPQTGKIQICFTGSHDNDGGNLVQSIYVNDDSFAIATENSKCKEYPDEIYKDTILSFQWELPSQDSMRIGRESGEIRQDWPNAILVYQATE